MDGNGSVETVHWVFVLFFSLPKLESNIHPVFLQRLVWIVHECFDVFDRCFCFLLIEIEIEIQPLLWRLLSMLGLGPHLPVFNHLHTCDIVNERSTFLIYLKPVRHMVAPTTLNSGHTKRDATAAQLPVDLLVCGAAR